MILDSIQCMRKLLYILIPVLSISYSSDPIKIAMKDVLASARKDDRFVYNQKTLTLLKGMDYRLPLLQKLDLRYGTDDYGVNRSQYGLGFSFNTFSQMKNQLAIKNAQMGIYEAQNDYLMQQAILDRYVTLTDIYFSNQLLDKFKTLETLLNLKNATQREMLQRGLDVRIKDIVDNENDKNSLQLSMSNLESNLANNYQKVKQFLGRQNDLDIDFKDIIAVKQVENIVNDVKKKIDLQMPELKLRKSQIGLANAELNLENAMNREYFSSFQLGFEQKPKTNLFENPFFRLGFNVPLLGNSRLKRNELALDILEAEDRFNLTYLTAQKEIKLQIVSIENLLKKYALFYDKNEKSIIKNILNNKKLTAELNASDLLDLKILQQKGDIEIVKIANDLTHEYVALLDKVGLLTASPNKNYLSVGLDNW